MIISKANCLLDTPKLCIYYTLYSVIGVIQTRFVESGNGISSNCFQLIFTVKATTGIISHAPVSA